MRRRTFIVDVTQRVQVELDDDKFDDDFMVEFRESFFSFHTVNEHAEHLAQLQARGIVDLDIYPGGNEFVEGYGLANDMGIRARVIDTEVSEVRP